jgi:hypothetical protein
MSSSLQVKREILQVGSERSSFAKMTDNTFFGDNYEKITVSTQVLCRLSVVLVDCCIGKYG